MALPLSWCTHEGDTRNMYEVAPFPARFHLRSPIKTNSKEYMKGCLRDVFCNVQKTIRQTRGVKQGSMHEGWWSCCTSPQLHWRTISAGGKGVHRLGQSWLPELETRVWCNRY